MPGEQPSLFVHVAARASFRYVLHLKYAARQTHEANVFVSTGDPRGLFAAAPDILALAAGIPVHPDPQQKSEL